MRRSVPAQTTPANTYLQCLPATAGSGLRCKYEADADCCNSAGGIRARRGVAIRAMPGAGCLFSVMEGGCHRQPVAHSCVLKELHECTWPRV